MKHYRAGSMRKAAIARLLRITREATEVMSIEQLNQLALRLAVALDETAAAKGHQTGYAASLERELGKSDSRQVSRVPANIAIRSERSRHVRYLGGRQCYLHPNVLKNGR